MPTQPWTIHVIYHSHTDIGYTDRQEKIARYHADYIKQAVELVERNKADGGESSFKWNCETFWQVEQFMNAASGEMIERFESALKQGHMELTANYLNMTELVHYDVLIRFLQRAKGYADGLGIPLQSAMTADINGFGWGYADALAEVGVQNLFTGIHTHHGMFPAGGKQRPFKWLSPSGAEVLVWIGEGYHFGNDLGIVPDQNQSYYIKDGRAAHFIVEDQLAHAEARIFDYLSVLEEEGYPLRFLPVHACGVYLDNAPPNGAIVPFIEEWNKRFGDRVKLQMSTVTSFFDQVRSEEASGGIEIPVYRGDWPDWWSDGVASTAAHTRIFRQAQRTWSAVRKLDAGGNADVEDLLARGEEQLMLYAEHTWGHASSVSEPWQELVQTTEARKLSAASEAHRLIHLALDETLAAKGEAPLSAERPLSFKVICTENEAGTIHVPLRLDNWEYPRIAGGFEVKLRDDGRALRHQREGGVIWVELPIHCDATNRLDGATMEEPFPNGTATSPAEATSVLCPTSSPFEAALDLYPTTPKPDRSAYGSFRLNGADDVVQDLRYWAASDRAAVDPSLPRPIENGIETESVRIEWRIGEGIVSWLDKPSGIELLRGDRKHDAFTPVYEVTPAGAGASPFGVRQRFGRNRKGPGVERHAGELRSASIVSSGPLFVKASLEYRLPGTEFYRVELTAYRHARVDVSVTLHKDSVWAPENVYISLPFTSGDADETLWIDKIGSAVRPQIDQIPGTLIDFYCIQEGAALEGESRSLAISATDAPLLQLGSLEYGPRSLAEADCSRQSYDNMYSWILNNGWETNFKATLAGFYEFRYKLAWREDGTDARRALQTCGALNAEPFVIRTY